MRVRTTSENGRVSAGRKIIRKPLFLYSCQIGCEGHQGTWPQNPAPGGYGPCTAGNPVKDDPQTMSVTVFRKPTIRYIRHSGSCLTQNPLMCLAKESGQKCHHVIMGTEFSNNAAGVARRDNQESRVRSLHPGTGISRSFP